jgi:hypothetical protein
MAFTMVSYLGEGHETTVSAIILLDRGFSEHWGGGGPITLAFFSLGDAFAFSRKAATELS